MPFRETSTAARCGGVLGDKYGMAAERRLFAIVRGIGRSEAFPDEASGVIEHGIEAFTREIALVCAR